MVTSRYLIYREVRGERCRLNAWWNILNLILLGQQTLQRGVRHFIERRSQLRLDCGGDPSFHKRRRGQAHFFLLLGAQSSSAVSALKMALPMSIRTSTPLVGVDAADRLLDFDRIGTQLRPIFPLLHRNSSASGLN